MKTWLVFDIGTGSTKAAVITAEGIIIQDASASYSTQTQADGIMEQVADDWWGAVRAVVHALRSPAVDAIAITGQMQDVILLDERGNSLRPVILYSDTRARAEAEQIEKALADNQLRHLTGNDQDAGSLLAKLLWLTHHEPDSIQNARSLLMGAADYISFKLTDRAVTDTTTAATTGLLNLNSRQWLDAATFAQLGLEKIIPLLPTLIHGGAKVGELSAKAADQLGLTAGIPVFHAPGDAGASTLGAGSGIAGTAYAYVGTSGWVAFTASQPALAPGVITLAHPQPESFIQIAPLMTAGGNLDWVKNLFQQEDYDTLIQQALARPPSSLIYLPYLRGERAPFSDPLAQAAFIGINDRTEKADFYRAVLEGIIFAYRHCLEALTTTPIETLTLTGGGTRSEAWCQLFADVVGIPVVLAAEPEHGGIRGTLLSALVAAGLRPSYAPQGFLPEPQLTLQPQSALRSHYDDQYALFRDLYPTLQAHFARRTK